MTVAFDNDLAIDHRMSLPFGRCGKTLRVFDCILIEGVRLQGADGVEPDSPVGDNCRGGSIAMIFIP